MKNPSWDVFTRMVNERYANFRENLRALTQRLPQDERGDKADRVRAVLDSAKTLQMALSQVDQPPWLSPLVATLAGYLSTANLPPTHHAFVGNAQNLLTSLIAHGNAALNHTWQFAETDSIGFDFDDVFRQYETQSRLSELFDDLIGMLQSIIDSGDVDSVRILRSLESLIATLKKNRNGSFFGVMGTWHCIYSYLKNVAWEYLTGHPSLAPWTKALRKTMEQIDKELQDVAKKTESHLVEKLSGEFPVLRYEPLPIAALPAPTALDGEIVDVEFTKAEETEALGKENGRATDKRAVEAN